MLSPSKSLLLHPQERKAEYGGKALILGELSYKLLALLVERAPSPVPFDLIEEHVWSASVTRETVKQRVKLLRDDLAKIGMPDGAIEAMRNSGYRFAIAAPKQSPQRKLTWGSGVFFVVLAIAAAFGLLAVQESSSSTLTLTIKEEVAPQHDDGTKWSGVRQTLMRELTKLDGIIVVDPSAQNTDQSDLRVTLSPYRQGGDEGYSVQLTDVRTGFVMWVEIYRMEGAADNRAALHAANHVQAIVAALGGDLGAAGYPAQSSDIQQSYMQALRYWRQGNRSALESARRRLEEVKESSPEFELATSLLVRVEADLVLKHGYPRTLAVSGKRTMQTLLDKHPDFADFRYSLAQTMLALGEQNGALAELRRAEPSMPFLVRNIRVIEAQLDTQGDSCRVEINGRSRSRSPAGQCD